MILDQKSLQRLRDVHPLLALVIQRTARDWDASTGLSFIVTCGARTLAEQKRLLAAKATTTLRSRHIPSGNPPYSHAVDLAVKLNGTLKWDWPLYAELAKRVKNAAARERVNIEWGGDWKSFKDGPHFQLPWKKFPG